MTTTKDDRTGFYTAEELEAMPTIHQGQYADLKIDTGSTRVWLSRMTPEDGETQPVQCEQLIDGCWVDALPRKPTAFKRNPT